MSKGTTLLVLLAFYVSASIAADSDDTELTKLYRGWKPEPKGRGTWRIIFSCLSTLGLCIWTAIHPDIVPGTSFQRLRRKIRLGMLALLTPDVIVQYSFMQWREARDTRNKLLKEWPKGVEKHELLEMEGVYFAIMGGYRDESDKSENRPDGTQLSVGKFIEKMKEEVERERFRKITLEDIKDKGKASGLAKFLVCIQVGWLVVQQLGRVASGLPRVLLELHVVIQVLVAAVVYGFWWYKPLDVQRPIDLLDKDTITPAPHFTPTHGNSGREIATDKETAPSSISSPVPEKHDLQSEKESGIPQVTASESPKVLERVRASVRNPRPRRQTYPEPTPGKPQPIWRLEEMMVIDIWGTIRPIVQIYQKRRPKPCGINDILLRDWDSLLPLFFYLAYSGLHATAWNSQFPTPIERWIWRGSCLGVGLAPVLIYIIAILRDIYCGYRDTSRDPEQQSEGRRHYRRKSAEIVGNFFRHIITTVYMLSAAYLLVEPFLSLRELPSGAFVGVPWASYIPHI